MTLRAPWAAFLIAAVLSTGLALPTAGQAHSPAILLSVQSGEIIGAASVCGVPEA